MKGLVHNYTVVSRTYKSEGLDSPQQGRFPVAPPQPFLVSLFCALQRFDSHGQGLIHIMAELGLPTE